MTDPLPPPITAPPDKPKWERTRKVLSGPKRWWDNHYKPYDPWWKPTKENWAPTPARKWIAAGLLATTLVAVPGVNYVWDAARARQPTIQQVSPNLENKAEIGKKYEARGRHLIAHGADPNELRPYLQDLDINARISPNGLIMYGHLLQTGEWLTKAQIADSLKPAAPKQDETAPNDPAKGPQDSLTDLLAPAPGHESHTRISKDGGPMCFDDTTAFLDFLDKSGYEKKDAGSGSAAATTGTGTPASSTSPGASPAGTTSAAPVSGVICLDKIVDAVHPYDSTGRRIRIQPATVTADADYTFAIPRGGDGATALPDRKFVDLSTYAGDLTFHEPKHNGYEGMRMAFWSPNPNLGRFLDASKGDWTLSRAEMQELTKMGTPFSMDQVYFVLTNPGCETAYQVESFRLGTHETKTRAVRPQAAKPASEAPGRSAQAQPVPSTITQGPGGPATGQPGTVPSATQPGAPGTVAVPREQPGAPVGTPGAPPAATPASTIYEPRTELRFGATTGSVSNIVSNREGEVLGLGDSWDSHGGEFSLRRVAPQYRFDARAGSAGLSTSGGFVNNEFLPPANASVDYVGGDFLGKKGEGLGLLGGGSVSFTDTAVEGGLFSSQDTYQTATGIARIGLGKGTFDTTLVGATLDAGVTSTTGGGGPLEDTTGIGGFSLFGTKNWYFTDGRYADLSGRVSYSMPFSDDSFRDETLTASVDGGYNFNQRLGVFGNLSYGHEAINDARLAPGVEGDLTGEQFKAVAGARLTFGGAKRQPSAPAANAPVNQGWDHYEIKAPDYGFNAATINNVVGLAVSDCQPISVDFPANPGLVRTPSGSLVMTLTEPDAQGRHRATVYGALQRGAMFGKPARLCAVGDGPLLDSGLASPKLYDVAGYRP